MALTAFQREILSLLAAHRSPDSVFGGGATLNRHGPRRSGDFDIEHVTVQAVRDSFERDRDTLLAAGYVVEETRMSRPERGFAEAVVRSPSGSTLVDWTYDSAVRFYPAIEDPEFGWRLHDVDLAVNKVLAMAGRREPRDYHDVVSIHRSGLHLAILAWAACGKDPGMVPDLVLDEITRNSSFTAQQMHAMVDTDEPVDAVALKRDLLEAVAQARDLFAGLPRVQAGHLYVDRHGEVRLPDPEGVASGELLLHEATVGGAWPRVFDT